jgi:hypothetical protein
MQERKGKGARWKEVVGRGDAVFAFLGFLEIGLEKLTWRQDQWQSGTAG